MRYVIPIILLLIFSGACERERTIENSMMERAESLMQDHPDSALRLLDSVQSGNLRGKREKARYGLLKTIALHKNYIDTTTFDILQPALDYYPEHGNPDEHFKTLYYQGCIYLNRGDLSNAMDSYIRAREVSGITDSITFAHLLISQGKLYYQEYRGEKFLNNVLAASQIYNRRGEKYYESNALADILNGAAVTDKKQIGDSALTLALNYFESDPDYYDMIMPRLLAYFTSFRDFDRLRYYLGKVDFDNSDNELKLSIIHAYRELGEFQTAINLLSRSNVSKQDSARYFAISSQVYEEGGDFEKALKDYRQYMSIKFDKHLSFFEQDFLFAEKKHELEMARLQEKNRKEKVILFSIVGALVLVIAGSFIYFKYRQLKLVREADLRQLERERDEKRNIALEKSGLESEVEGIRTQITKQDSVLAKIMREKEGLEKERERLEEKIATDEKAFGTLRKTVTQSTDIFNSLFASIITSNSNNARLPDDIVALIKNDKAGFLNYLRAIMEVRNPGLPEFLEGKGLTDDEINYIYLTGLGLNAKEVGAYLGRKNLYNRASEIRKKLGLLTPSKYLPTIIKELMSHGAQGLEEANAKSRKGQKK